MRLQLLFLFVFFNSFLVHTQITLDKINSIKKINLKLTGALKSIIEIYLDAKIKDENIKYS